MSWSRGFFRLWVVAAALWLVGALTLSWQGIFNPRPYMQGYWVVTEAGELVAHASYTEAVYRANFDPNYQRVRIGTMEGIDFFVPRGTPETQISAAVDEIARQVAVEYSGKQNAERWGHVGMLFWGGVVFPLIVLAIGTGIGWALSGFRRSGA